MPIYEYRCANEHTFEVFQSMSEDPVGACIECGANAERVLRAPAVHFKGSGFYTTDYARRAAKKGDAASGGDSDSGGGEKKEQAGGKTEAPAAKSSDD